MGRRIWQRLVEWWADATVKPLPEREVWGVWKVRRRRAELAQRGK